MRRLAVCCLVLLTGCGLPLNDSVQEPRQVTAGQQQRGDIQVLPPGPRDDATPEQVVRGFFGAQSNPEARHASARAFLTPERRASWDDAGAVSVFDGQRGLVTTPVEERNDEFLVTGRRVGTIGKDGSYTRDDGTISITVRLRQATSGRWQISDVPDGLLLSTADRDRSFRPMNVYFLAPAGQTEGATTHLVPDRVFVPVTADPAQALVERLLAGPTQALGDSVETAVPDETSLRRPVSTDASGVVTVDLSAQVGAAPQQQREQLSAQLVWTLRSVGTSFSALRLQSEGRAVSVASTGSRGIQDRGDWDSYDPDGLQPREPAYYIADRRLRSLDAGLTSGPASGDENPQLIDVAALAARSSTLAVLTAERREWVLRTGPISGPLDVRWRSRLLASPSWGSGEQGVWFVDRGRVMLAPPGGRPFGVPVDGIGAYGPVVGLRASRDGARMALVVGAGEDRRLVVGRLRVVGGQVRVVALRAIAPNVAGVRDVSWDSATSLVVLGRFNGLPALPVRVAVDGSTVASLIRLGLEKSDPISLTAAPGRQLVVAALSGRTPLLFRDAGGVFARQAQGYAPFYPG